MRMKRLRAVLGIALGLAASLCWGVSDFLGGLESRRSPQIGVMLFGAGVGTAVLVLVAVMTSAPVPDAKYLLIGAAGGVCVTIALFAFYRGLSIGVMSVVAPIAATGVVLPVIVGLASGERPGAVRIGGTVVAILGVVLVSRQESSEVQVAAATGMSIALALVAALGFGGEFIALKAAAKGSPLWGATAAAGTYLVLVAALALLRGSPTRPCAETWHWLLALGLCFGAANAFYSEGTRHGQLATVAVAASLYPVITVILARGVLAERVRRIQQLGILAAMAGIVMIAAG